MYMYSLTTEQMEMMADAAGEIQLNWLLENEFLTEDQFNSLIKRRLHFLYKKASWYTRLWKKIWPNSKAETAQFVIVRLPEFKEN